MDTQPNPVLQRPVIYTSEEDKLRAKFRHPEFAARAGEWYIRWRGGENWYRVAKDVGLRIDTARALRMRPDIAEEEMGRDPEPPKPRIERQSITVAEIEAHRPPDEWRPPPREENLDATIGRPSGWSDEQWAAYLRARDAMRDDGSLFKGRSGEHRMPASQPKGRNRWHRGRLISLSRA